ncbi:hypothetical protein [Dictyobacter arantiisoli]|uniref:hypothetical protein n=1 Tax=Dictyobacter arantiisoli TaxID=2014874 RepID=UPI0011EC389C|nr:hypothetical protein [Dictyobacter arantiisoli]
MSSSRLFWIKLLQWGGALVLVFVLIIQLVYPSSFGIPPSLSLWKLALNSVVLIVWIVASGYFGKKISSSLIAFRPISSSPIAARPMSFYRLLIVNITGFIGLLLLIMMEVLTDGKSLDAAVQFGIFMGLLFGIVPIIQTFLSWYLYRRLK